MDEHVPTRSWLPKFLQRSKPQHSSPVDETSSLLPPKQSGVNDSSSPSSSPSQEEGEVYDFEEDSRDKSSKWHLIRHEFSLLAKSSLPVILAYTLQNSLQTVSVVIVGRSSPENLATAAFAYMFAMATAWLIALGGTTALDTLCSSTFTGSRDPYDLGVLLQRAFLVLGGFYVPVAVLWGFTEPIFLKLGQGEQLSHDAARFLWCLIPGGLGYVYFECMKKYLQAQG